MVTKPKRKSDLEDIHVVIPYQRLVELLSAAAELETCTSQLAALRREIAALRYQFSEVIEVLSYYKD